MQQPLLTAIVSTYNAERFIHGCLADLVAQTILSEIEVLVIDSGSQQREAAICQEFSFLYPQIKLVRTQREPLYAAWNRAIALARGKYLTSANTDDRHRIDFAEMATALLERHPEVALVYADQFVSGIENETHLQAEGRGASRRRWPKYTPADLMLRCITGSQPVWRRSLHGEFGLFDTRYRIAADYDMWLRFAHKYELLHLPEPLGVFFDSPETISGRNNRVQMNLESLRIRQTHLRAPRWRTVPGLRKQLAAELFGIGYRHISQDRDPRAATPFFLEAIKLDPTNVSFLKTYLLRCVARIASEALTDRFAWPSSAHRSVWIAADRVR